MLCYVLTIYATFIFAITDLQQWMLGVCQLDDIAAVVVTRVLGHYSYDGCKHLLVDCGWTALTLQGGGKVPSGGYGGIVNHPELK